MSKKTARKPVRIEPAIDRARFPALADFLSGYLHQDFRLAHELPVDAYRAYRMDASTREMAALLRESRTFLDLTAKQSWPMMRDAFAKLGGAWRPPSRAALERFLATLGDTSMRGRP